MMLDPADLRSLRQQVFQMPAPTGRVLALPVATRSSPIQYRLDPSSHPVRGFRLCMPNRLQRLHDEADIDRLNRQVTEDRVHITAECGRPLGGVLFATPAGSVRLDVALGTFAKD